METNKMSSEEWEARYIKNSGITKEEYDKFLITVPCDCGWDGCNGWAAESRMLAERVKRPKRRVFWK